MTLNFQQLDPRAILPVKAHEGDAGYDLCSLEDFTLDPGQRTSIGTGVAVEIPTGMAGLVLPRSGTAARHGITLVNSPGLIDSGYRGEIKVLLLNTDASEVFSASAGERIAQLLVVSYPEMSPQWVDSLSESERSAGGFGSTG